MKATTTTTRGRYSISLRVLMLAVLVVGGVLGWTANRANKRRWPVAAVKKLHGAVQFDYQYSNDQFHQNGKSLVPPWLLALFSDEFIHDVTVVNRLDYSEAGEKDSKAATEAIAEFDKLERLRMIEPPPGTAISGLERLKVLNVSLNRPQSDRPIRLGPLTGLTEAHFDGPGVGDSMLAELRDVPSLREIRLQNTSVTDAGLARLEGPANLEVLWLGNSQVTDAGLPALVKLKKLVILDLIGNRGVTDQGVQFLSLNVRQLKHLMVSRTGVTDSGLTALKRFAGLEGLQVEGRGAKITDAGLAGLKELAHLEVLNVAGSAVTDAGLGHLHELKKLRWLNLNRTSIGDAGLSRLGEIKSLRWLSLSLTNITDDGLAHLSALPNLEQLFIDGTKVTDRGLKHLYGLKSLKMLVVGGSEVSVEGVDALRAALPKSTLTRMRNVRPLPSSSASAP